MNTNKYKSAIYWYAWTGFFATIPIVVFLWATFGKSIATIIRIGYVEFLIVIPFIVAAISGLCAYLVCRNNYSRCAKAINGAGIAVLSFIIYCIVHAVLVTMIQAAIMVYLNEWTHELIKGFFIIIFTLILYGSILFGWWIFLVGFLSGYVLNKKVKL